MSRSCWRTGSGKVMVVWFEQFIVWLAGLLPAMMFCMLRKMFLMVMSLVFQGLHLLVGFGCLYRYIGVLFTASVIIFVVRLFHEFVRTRIPNSADRWRWKRYILYVCDQNVETLFIYNGLHNDYQTSSSPALGLPASFRVNTCHRFNILLVILIYLFMH